MIDDALVVSVKVHTRLGETHGVVEAEVVVEPVELEDEGVRGVLGVVVEECADDGKIWVVRPPTRLVIPLIIPPGPKGFAVLCGAAEVVPWLAALDEPLGLQRK